MKMFKSVNLKLSNMRKPQNFVVQDINDQNAFYIQSDKSIGIFDKETGKGKLNTKGKYFPHLQFATPYRLTTEELKNCLGALSVKGDILGSVDGCIIVNNGCNLY
jgi:hypothetical protein